MTINGMFIFFIIPILTGFSHIYFLKYYKNKKYILSMLIILSLGSTIHYANKYINKRDFMDLRNVSMDKTIDSKKLSSKLSGLKWVSCLQPNNPEKEIAQLLEVMEIIKNDNTSKSIITDYQFISVALSVYDFSQSHVWFINHVANQKRDSKFYKI